MSGPNYLVSWSGGKDSCFALYQAMRQGYNISHLINFISQEPHRVRFHGTDVKLIQFQSQALEIPVLQWETTWEGYEKDFKEAVLSLIPSGIDGMIFGDIYLVEHRAWAERVCRDLGIRAVEPLWGMNAADVLSNFIDVGFEAIVISAKRELMQKEWMGHIVDHSFREYLETKNIDPCGENGEYHTLVTAGPILKRRIRLLENDTIAINDYWVMEIHRYELEKFS